MPSPTKSSEKPSPPPEPLGPKCSVEPLAPKHHRIGFQCGYPELDDPLTSYSFSGPRNDRTYLVATLGGNPRVLGYATLEVYDLRLHNSIEGDSYYISWLAVCQDYHRKGIGTRLIAEVLLLAKDWIDARGPAPLSLHADTSIHRFYTRLGFTSIDERLLSMPANVLSDL